MTTATFDAPAPATADPLREAIEDVAGVPEAYSEAFNEPEQKVKELVIVNWSGDLDKVWPVLILSSTAAASGVRARVFVTFWGLLPFVKDGKRVVGENWMQKMLTLMQRPGIDHLKLSKMNFAGMGPWMMGTLRKKYNVASPRELLEAATAMGVEFIPCQMTMDMFGLKREDLIDEMGEPAGAATAIEIMTEADASLFI
ncbi:MAG TPA: DsrE/DsrF/DrsH-like family protein [Candidatus Limnocylindria bacterium]|nr:DsrE/DsrF/DrsH-like family protein [Candidatus Limnocylindria bacterium]